MIIGNKDGNVYGCAGDSLFPEHLSQYPFNRKWLFKMHVHREITLTAISGPRFHAPLHIFPPPPGPAGVRRTPEGVGVLAGGI